MNKGLTNSQAKELLKNYGYNEIADKAKTSPLKILLRQIKSNFIVYLLFATVIISFFVGKDSTAYTIIGVIVLVIGVGFVQEYKAEEAIASLKKMIMPETITYRDGKKTEIPSRELVPGDFIVLGNGEKIPADCVIVEAHDLRVNESALTGESKEISKEQIGQNTSKSDKNELYMGTYIVNGRCVAKVEHTGMNTKFGKIAHLISTAEKEMPLQVKINNIAKYMVTVAIIMASATGALMYFRAPEINSEVITEILILVVALSVSAFPEGFPVVLITTLAVGAKRMSNKNAIVNRMSIIETLGDVTVICTDKTGTLTRGEMTVKYIFTGNNLYQVEGSGYIAHGNIIENDKPVNVNEHSNLQQVIETGLICNDAEIERTGVDNEYKSIGSPTEAALLILGAKTNHFKEKIAGERINERPFNSSKKMMSILFKKDQEHYVYAKGAPEILIEKCSHIIINNKTVALKYEEKEKILKLQQEMAGNAFRTLALAYKKHETTDKEYTEEDLIFVGLVAIEDPPREEVQEALLTAKNAGIRVVMATGDNKETAISIAKQVGIDPIVMEGNELDNLSDKELLIKINQVSVFARVRPEHKMRLIKAFKELDHIVAMTGDGVNDAPALKEAHVGIAMGKNGTDVSRTASDLILKDDNFATIVSAIQEGRNVFNNIKKFVTYQLSCNMSELMTLFVGVLFAPLLGWQTPLLLSIQILFMNLITDNAPAITLGLNPTSKDIMDQKPSKNKNILTKNLIVLLLFTATIMASATLIAYYVSFNILNLSTEESRTIALITLIIAEIFTAFSYRSFRKLVLNRSLFVNKNLVYASMFSFVATLAIVYTPLKATFGTVSIGLLGWGIAFTLAFCVLLINDLIRFNHIKKYY